MKNKYNATKTVVDGIKFDSKKESKRYKELKLLEKAGVIKDLGLQIKFELVPKTNTERAANYYADFVYYDVENNILVIEDVKGMKTPLYNLKRKIVKWKYPEYRFIES